MPQEHTIITRDEAIALRSIPTTDTLTPEQAALEETYFELGHFYADLGTALDRVGEAMKRLPDLPVEACNPEALHALYERLRSHWVATGEHRGQMRVQLGYWPIRDITKPGEVRRQPLD